MMENMKKAREERHLSQVAVQLKTGIDQAQLSKMENGERLPTVEHLQLLAELYNTSFDYLMDRTDEKKPYPPKAK